MNETHLTIERLICLKNLQKKFRLFKKNEKNNKGHIHTYKKNINTHNLHNHI